MQTHPSQPTDATLGRWDDIRITILGSLLYLAGSGVLYVMPSYLDHLSAVFRLSASQAGLVSGGETLSIACSALLSGLVINRFGPRLALASILVCILGDLASNAIGRFDVLFGVRVLTGVFGEGPAYALGFAVLARSPNPDRAFGWAFLVIVAVASGAIGWSQQLNGLGPCGVLLPFVALYILTGLSTLWTPKPRPAGTTRREQGPLWRAGGFWLLVGIAIWYGAPEMFWAFAVPISSGHGVSGAGIVWAMALSLGLGVIGAFLPILLGDRFGRVGPIFAATALLGVSTLAAATVHHAALLAAGLGAFNSAWNLAAVYQLASLAVVDRTGRYTGFAAFAQVLGQAMGPAVGGFLIDGLGPSTVPWGVVALAVAGSTIFLAVALSSKIGAAAVPALVAPE